MRLQTCYKTTSTGAIQEWTVEVEGNKYRTHSGQKDGKIVTSEWTTCEGKNIGKANETSPEAQAMAEATAKRDKKLKTDYVESLALLGDNEVAYVEPMLAKSFKDRKDKIKYNVGVQCKYNGVRCVATRHGLFSRKGERYVSVPHILESLQEFFKQYPDAVLDGELFNYDLRKKLNELVSLCRKSKNVTEEELAQSKKIVQYHVYDGYNFDKITKQSFYLDRSDAISRNLKNNPYYRFVKTNIAVNEEQVYAIYQNYTDDGHEGAIVRALDAPYENKRSANLLKIKPTDDAEFLILDVEEGKGNRSGMAGRVILQMNDGSGRTFASNLKGDESQFAEVLQNKQNYIGKTATIFYNGFTGKGIPNSAQFDCNNYMHDKTSKKVSK